MNSLQALPETRQRILEAASQVFSAKGFRNATVREICAAADVNLAAVNYHFGDKERLYIETIKQAHRFRADQVSLPAWSHDTPAEERLHDFVTTLLERMLNDPASCWHQQLMLRELAQPTAACEELVRDYIRPHFEMLLSIIDCLVPAETTTADRQLIAFSIIGQCIYHRVAQPVVRLLLDADAFSNLDVPRLADHITRFSLAAIGRVAAPSVEPTLYERPAARNDQHGEQMR
jgi:AcrR family transcriptional regulator